MPRVGQIPEIRTAIASPVRLADNLTTSRHVLEVLPSTR
jgi:hypothetical protein